MFTDVPEISPRELAEEMRSDSNPVILDVREAEELKISALGASTHIPLGELGARFRELDPEPNIVVVCRSGHRSAMATAFLLRMGCRRVRNLTGGLNGWATEVDPNMAIY